MALRSWINTLRIENNKKSKTEGFKESPSGGAGVEESVKAGQRRPATSKMKCTA